MPKPYQMSIPTGITKEGKEVLATVDKSCGSGSGGDCLPVTCRVCVGTSIDVTFGGALSGIGVITLDVISSGGDTPSYQASTPFMGISTPCGQLDILFQIGTDGTSYLLEVRLNGDVIMLRIANPPMICLSIAPDDPPDFIFPYGTDSDGEGNVGPNITVSGNEDGCNGVASIVVTNTADGGDGSGSTNPYDFAVDTLITKEGLRVLAAVDCAAAGSGPNLYWYGYDTGIRKNNKRVFWGYNPCCGPGPTQIVDTGCCPDGTNRELTLTFMWRPQTFPPTTVWTNTASTTVTYYSPTPIPSIVQLYRGIINLCGEIVYILVSQCPASQELSLLWLSKSGYPDPGDPYTMFSNSGWPYDLCYPFYRVNNYGWHIVFGVPSPTTMFPCLDMGGSGFDTNNIAAYLSV